jgi:hypothetical protein
VIALVKDDKTKGVRESLERLGGELGTVGVSLDWLEGLERSQGRDSPGIKVPPLEEQNFQLDL